MAEKETRFGKLTPNRTKTGVTYRFTLPLEWVKAMGTPQNIKLTFDGEKITITGIR